MDLLDRLTAERESRHPGFTARVDAEVARLRARDELVNTVLDRLAELGWTREELARRAELNAAALRRLLTSADANPTLATMTAIASALGLRLEFSEQVGAETLRSAG